METLTLTIKGLGFNAYEEMYHKLNKFVEENFDLLYRGAEIIGSAIEKDYYAPRRISIYNDNRSGYTCGQTRLHEHQGLKYTAGFKYNETHLLSEEAIRCVVKDLQMLLDAAAYDTHANFDIQIINKNN